MASIANQKIQLQDTLPLLNRLLVDAMWSYWGHQSQALDALLTTAYQNLECEHIAILIASPKLDRLIPRMGTLLSHVALSYHALKLQKLSPAEREPYLTATVDTIEQEADILDAQTYLRIPLEHQGIVVGCIVFYDKRLCHWSAVHVALANTIASNISNLLGSIIASYQETSFITVTSAIQRITQIDLQQANLSLVLKAILDESMELVNATHANIYLMHDDELRLATQAKQHNHPLPQVFQLGQGVVGQVALHHRPILVEDYATYPFARTEIIEASAVSSILGLPLFREGELVGVLEIYHLKDDLQPPFMNEDLRLLQILAPMTAIALEKARWRDTIRLERSQLQAVLDHARAPILLFNKQQTLVLANPAAEQVSQRVGLSIYSFIGKTIQEIIPKIPSELETPTWGERFAIGEPFELFLPDVGTFIIQVAEMLGKDEEDEIDGFVVVAQEVTEERRLNDVTSELLHVLSHDLGNILSLGLGYTALMLEEKPKDDAEYFKYMRRIFDSLNRARSLIKDVVELEYAKQHGLQIAKPYSLEETLQFVVSDLRDQADFNDQELAYTVQQAPINPLVGNRSLVKQAFDNLVSNGLKYTPKGGQVNVHLNIDNTHAIITVSDTGIGIPPDDLPNIFERHYRVKSDATSNIQGTGIGLNLVQSVIEQHNGTIKVTSQVGTGSVFTVYLPLVSEHIETQPQQAAD